MIRKEEVVKEFELRIFEESYKRIYKCLSMIDENQLWDSPNGNIPSIGCLILHLCGNARQWVLSGLCDMPDNRNREDEFVIHRNIRKSDFVFLLENLKMQLKDNLKDMPESQLVKHTKIQDFDVSGYSAITHVIEHFSYHTGQITFLAKLYSNQETNYYSGLDLGSNNRLN
ncbi:MAG TPA: DUF1572 domain-containing protein [Crocinitomicaceae bacterium]|nr:DUF1572 domain-containing protein [Crocinitomicaceae bacterium]